MPGYDYLYHMWDTLTTGYLGAPHCITFREVHSRVIPTGPSAGQTAPVTDGGGRPVKVAHTVDVAQFLDYFLALLRC
jgi:inosine-uridine nucleoside N-ribohydrolase